MKSSQRKISGTSLPTRTQGLLFSLKAWGLQRKRVLRDIFSTLSRHKPNQTPQDAVLLGECISPLWTGEETAKALITGKIHNIRSAVKYLNGIVVPQGQIFSFWKQVGKLTKRRGYTIGRELREGCIIPNVGGGICQLTNAIYDAALKAGVEIVERHRHSQVIKGSLAEQDRDATVFWNYLDLRLRSSKTWQLQVKMSREYLIVRIFGEKKEKSAATPKTHQTPDAVGDCTQCGRTDCYLHTGDIPLHEHTTYLSTEDDWIEFVKWREGEMKKGDKLISTSQNPPFLSIAANFTSKLLRRYHLWLGDLEYMRRPKVWDAQYFYNWRKHPLPVAQNARAKFIAKHFAKKLTASDTHLVIPQSLLVWLYLEGELEGREYDVAMSSLPITHIQKRLDDEWKLHHLEIDKQSGRIAKIASLYGSEIPTTGDFRAPKWLVEAENEALAGAVRLISPHSEILKFAQERGVPLKWSLPKPVKNSASDECFRIFLASSPMARKGVFELRLALNNLLLDGELLAGKDNFTPKRVIEAKSVNFELLLLNAAVESENFWKKTENFPYFKEIKTRKVNSIKEGVALCDIVVLPAVVEHNPRALLLGLSSGKPVFASSACGLSPELAYSEINGYEKLAKQIKVAYAKRKSA